MNISIPARSVVSRRRLMATIGGAGLTLGLAPLGLGAGRNAIAQEATPSAGPNLEEPTIADLPYTDSGNPAHLLDLYLPETSSAGALPLVIWIHGGGWISGDKHKVGVRYLLEDGYAIASINYRLMQEELPPAQIQDANAAAAFLWSNADEYGLDRERFVLGGSSAGGRSTSLAGLSANNDVPEFEASPDVRFAALLDFFGGIASVRAEGRYRRQERLLRNLTPTDRIRMASLIDTLTYVDGDDPPVLIVHGEEDTTVPIEESEELATTLEAAGVPVEFERIPGKGHGILNFQDEPTKTIVREFLATYVG